MKLKAFRFISVALLLGWMLMIFFLSNETAAVSSQTSGGFSKLLFSLLYPPFREMPSPEQQELVSGASFIIRKLAHFTIYGILGVLALLSVISYGRLSYILRCSSALLICAAYAAFDEWHQTFIDGRSGELRDVILDSCGALTFIIIAGTVIYIRNCRRKKPSGSDNIDKPRAD